MDVCLSLGNHVQFGADSFSDWAYQKLDNDPYIQGAAPYMDKAIAWARQTQLKVWIDLHGAPGSQNGFDNSGHLTKTPSWTQGDTTKQTLSVIEQIANKYAKGSYQDVVVAIELLNEPLPDKLSGTDAIIQFSKDGYGKVRDVSDMPVVVHDAFQEGTFWNSVLGSSQSKNGNSSSNFTILHKLIGVVVIDHHEYQVCSLRSILVSPLMRVKVFSDKEVARSTTVSRYLIQSQISPLVAEQNERNIEILFAAMPAVTLLTPTIGSSLVSGRRQ